MLKWPLRMCLISMFQRYPPKTIIPIPNVEAADTPYLGTLDPQGTVSQVFSSGFARRGASTRFGKRLVRGAGELVSS